MNDIYQQGNFITETLILQPLIGQDFLFCIQKNGLSIAILEKVEQRYLLILQCENI